MKNRFTTLDIVYLVHELQSKLVGLRVDQIYDIDKRTYLIRLMKPGGVKKVLVIESGTRCHTTTFDWPKNPAPSGFSMKLRKHLNNKRLEKVEQLGADRIIHFQFGMEAAAYHLFLELYDKGNLILTDHAFTILHLVRPRIANTEERLAAHEKYAVDNAKQTFILDRAQVEEILRSKTTGTLREAFLSHVEFGITLFSYSLSKAGLTPQMKMGQLVKSEEDRMDILEKLCTAFEFGRALLTNVTNSEGIIVLSKAQASKEPQPDNGEASTQFFDEFHPAIVAECFPTDGVKHFDSFDEAIDEFFSKMESQKLDMKQLSQEKDALKKLEKVKIDQEKRIRELNEAQETDKVKAELITTNQTEVDMAISTIRKLVANQIPWDTIQEQLDEARKLGDPLATIISSLNLKQNKITLKLSNPYDTSQPPVNIEVNLTLSAFGNASKYFDLKKASAKKEERTLESQGKALKSTEKKTMASLKEAATIHSIKKARKVMWFEKFRWFITSENYLVIAGRDAQQNELLVKRYMRLRDVYMHADAHGSPTLLIKNPNPSEDISPKSLNEVGIFAVSCSGSWESKIVASSWWVWGDQVSKSAPTGEYLPTGSFMIRGKKNYLPPYQLVLGFGLLFRVTEDSMEAHKGERDRRFGGEDASFENSADKNTKEEEVDLPSDRDEEDEFPDTHVDLKVNGIKFSAGTTEEAEEFLVTSALPSTATSVQKIKNKQKKIAKNTKAQGKEKDSSNQKGKANKEPQPPEPQAPTSDRDRPKRGQHGRKKKLKEKYKDQDEEERQLRMKLLRTGQLTIDDIRPPQDNTVTQNSDESEDEQDVEEEKPLSNEEQPRNEEGISGETESGAKDDETPVQEIEEEETAEGGETELDLLKALTGSPLEGDELLYAVPVVAPYSTLQNYKFRIKMIPGTTKRGKAAKTALESFLREKDASAREKDLIKAVKDQDFARNFPGKVKLSNVIRDKK